MSAGVEKGLGGALAALVGERLDVADVLAHLLADCAEVTGAVAVAILARDGVGELSLLTATSHGVTELEMLQAQRHVGPCVETMQTRRPVWCSDRGEIVQRWGEVGEALVGAGVASVGAYPMRYRGEVLGGLNLFWSTSVEPPPEGVAQAYADMATVVVVQSGLVPSAVVRERLHEAMDARQVVEQAKGVIAYVDDVDLEEAYVRLVRRAEASGSGLTATAHEVVDRRGRD